MELISSSPLDTANQTSVPQHTVAEVPKLNSTGLFQGHREIRIEHEGMQYRLRITRRNKLILQK
jgi:hemin uptake protein HemP